jgi:hypothetical protein
MTWQGYYGVVRELTYVTECKIRIWRAYFGREVKIWRKNNTELSLNDKNGAQSGRRFYYHSC